MNSSQPKARVSLSPRLTKAILVATTMQLAAMLFIPTLDGGDSASQAIAAIVAHWIVILVVAVRRPVHHTRADLVIICVSFPVLLIAISVAAEYWGGRKWW